MTVGELIQILEREDKNLPVALYDDEYGENYLVLKVYRDDAYYDYRIRKTVRDTVVIITDSVRT